MNLLRDFLAQVALVSTITSLPQIFHAVSAEKQRMKMYRFAAYGLAILLCMAFPAYLNSGARLDIRGVPLLLGTLYGGAGTGIALSGLIVLSRAFIGFDVGLYTTLWTLMLYLPVILWSQRVFQTSGTKKRLSLAVSLAVLYCIIGFIVIVLVRGFSVSMLQQHGLHFVVTILSTLLLTAINELISGMLARNRQLQTEARDAEIAFLRSQINPHFLYNTLNSIATLCLKDPVQAEELTLEFSQYLRRSFAFNRLDSLTDLSHELELVKAYLNVEKARFGARLSVEYEIDAPPDTPIPPLIVQPLVENAVRHGLMCRLRGGLVKISVQQTGGEVCCIVEDNGCGMNAEQVDSLLHSAAYLKGVGIRNISQRLELLYGRGLQIESAENVGTKISFRIPALKIAEQGGKV